MAASKPKAKAKKKKGNLTDERYKYAQSILETNSDEVRETVSKMVTVMQKMAPTTDERVHVWVAVRLLVAAAEWDIRIANFKLPTKKCARCLKKVKS